MKMQQTSLSRIVKPLLLWYGENARRLPWRENRNPYRIWVSEIMLQQTRVDTVIGYFERFTERLPDVQALANVPEDELIKLWEGLGYYARVRNMQKAARIICTRYGGVFPSDYEDIRALPGIGDYTAGAIFSIAFSGARAAVDGNVLRVLSRLSEDGRDIKDPAVKKEAAAGLEAIYPAHCPGDFTQSIMELGAVICLPNGAPKCALCPLKGLCNAYLHGTQLNYPHKAEKAPRKKQIKTVFLLLSGDTIAVRRRRANGLLAGMWEFPAVDGHLSPEEVYAFLTEAGIAVSDIAAFPMKKHIFTHIEWHMYPYLVHCDSTPPDVFGTMFATKKQLHREIALPTAFKKLLPDGLIDM